MTTTAAALAPTFTVRIDLADGSESYPCLPPSKALETVRALEAQGYPVKIWCVETGRPATKGEVSAEGSRQVLKAAREAGAAFYAEAGRGYNDALDGDYDAESFAIDAPRLGLSKLDSEVLWPRYAMGLRTESRRLAAEATQRAEWQAKLDANENDLFAAMFADFA